MSASGQKAKDSFLWEKKTAYVCNYNNYSKLSWDYFLSQTEFVTKMFSSLCVFSQRLHFTLFYELCGLRLSWRISAWTTWGKWITFQHRNIKTTFPAPFTPHPFMSGIRETICLPSTSSPQLFIQASCTERLSCQGPRETVATGIMQVSQIFTGVKGSCWSAVVTPDCRVCCSCLQYKHRLRSELNILSCANRLWGFANILLLVHSCF